MATKFDWFSVHLVVPLTMNHRANHHIYNHLFFHMPSNFDIFESGRLLQTDHTWPQPESATQFSLSSQNTSTQHQKKLITSLKTLFNIVEAPFNFFFLLWCLCCLWCSDGPINSQEYKSFEIYAVSIKISMTEYHHWINDLVDHLF